jgi:hypothetical protein
MADHPSTFGSGTNPSGEQAWDDRASILPLRQDSDMSVDGTPLLRGTFAEMIRHITQLPEGERQGYVIAKAGDRHYNAEEAMELASHPDFPAKGSA